MIKKVLRKAIKIEKQYGEEIRKKFKNQNVLDEKCKIETDENFIYLPLKFDLKNKIHQVQNLENLNFTYTDFKFEQISKRVNSDYRCFLNNIPEKLEEYLPTSFDMVGTLAVIRLEKRLKNHQFKIGNAILKSNSNLTGVFWDKGVQGKFRIRELKNIGGCGNTHTYHKEYGLIVELDLSKVYFSPRLATERRRLANLVKGNEKILDMFAGVGPISLMIGKYNPGAKVYANDLNTESIFYLKKNIKTNKSQNIFPICQNANKLPEYFNDKLKFDRIIMNLPHNSLNFLEPAFKMMKTGWIHLYNISHQKEWIENQKSIFQTAGKKNRRIEDIHVNKIKSYSPSINFVCYDIQVR